MNLQNYAAEFCVLIYNANYTHMMNGILTSKQRTGPV